MIRSQRRVHRWIWTGLAVLLPLALAGILALSASQTAERAPQLIEPPAASAGGGG